MADQNNDFIHHTLRSKMGSSQSTEVYLSVEISSGKTQIIVEHTISQRLSLNEENHAYSLLQYNELAEKSGRRAWTIKDLIEHGSDESTSKINEWLDSERKVEIQRKGSGVDRLVVPDGGKGLSVYLGWALFYGPDGFLKSCPPGIFDEIYEPMIDQWDGHFQDAKLLHVEPQTWVDNEGNSCEMVEHTISFYGKVMTASAKRCDLVPNGMAKIVIDGDKYLCEALLEFLESEAWDKYCTSAQEAWQQYEKEVAS